MGYKQHSKDLVRCSYTGRIVNGKPVVLVSEVISYVKALGYTVFDFSLGSPVLTHDQLMRKIYNEKDSFCSCGKIGQTYRNGENEICICSDCLSSRLEVLECQ